MDLKDLDLNLLIVFNELMRQPRVSAVAEALDLSQPAVSNALKRLRRALGNELFVHTPRGMRPTPFAEQIAEPIAAALSSLESTLTQHASFDPATSHRSFVIAMTDVGEIYFMPQLMSALASQAPHVNVSTVRNTAVNLRDEMEAGRVDLAVGLLPQLKTGFFQRRLFNQRYVCMFRRGHPLDRGEMTLDDFVGAEHVVIISAGTGHGHVDELLEEQGIHRRVRLTVPHFVGVAHILHSTDLVATVPERLAERSVQPFGLTYVGHPASLPPSSISVLWHSRMHHDAGNQWLRSLMFTLFSDRRGDSA
jgi:DNA-binding transcriptional LysR family regulator